MPGTFTDSGAGKLYKGGLVSGGVLLELLVGTTSAPDSAVEAPTTGGYLGGVTVAEASWEIVTVGTERVLRNASQLIFGNVNVVANWGSQAPNLLRMRSGATTLWSDDIAISNFTVGRQVIAAAGQIQIRIPLVGTEV